MTNQEKKAYLGRYRDNEREIVRLREEIRRWDTIACGGGQRITGMPGGGAQDDRIQSAVEQIVQRQRELTIQYGRAARLAGEIEQAVNSVSDERLRLLLRYRYIDGWTWERIAVELQYCYMQICRLHGRALSEMML